VWQRAGAALNSGCVHLCTQPDSLPVMAMVGIRELRASLATYLRRAASGERIIVTTAGAPAAQLGPLTGDDSGQSLADLVALGRVEPPRRRGDFVPAEPLTLYAGTRIDRALAEVRR